MTEDKYIITIPQGRSHLIAQLIKHGVVVEAVHDPVAAVPERKAPPSNLVGQLRPQVFEKAQPAAASVTESAPAEAPRKRRGTTGVTRVAKVNGLGALQTFQKVVMDCHSNGLANRERLRELFNAQHDPKTNKSFSKDTFHAVMSKVRISGAMMDEDEICVFDMDQLLALEPTGLNKVRRRDKR